VQGHRVRKGKGREREGEWRKEREGREKKSGGKEREGREKKSGG
jgi:hypothetical protein